MKIKHPHKSFGSCDNPTATNWQDVDPSMPDRAIKVYLPGTKHGTREVFDKKVMLAGCKAVGSYDVFKADLGDKKKAEKECMKVRTDGLSVDIDGDYTETLASLSTNKNGIGVFGLLPLNNTDTNHAATTAMVLKQLQKLLQAANINFITTIHVKMNQMLIQV